MRLLTLLFSLLATPIFAHEFWLEPRNYQVAPEATIVADIVNGQDFSGSKLAYVPQRFAYFVAFYAGRAENVTGRVGDTPALQMPALGDGLHVFAYQADNATVSYENWEKFQRFVDHKDFGDVLARHRARGLPEENFKEIYSRYSKTLVGVGSGEGADLRTGLETEIVALTNPYTDDVSGGMRFQLFYRDDVRANVRFEVFEKAPDFTVVQTFYKTDDQGMVTIPVKPGYSYMADAVVLREPTPELQEMTGAVWETLWANMTWAIPR